MVRLLPLLIILLSLSNPVFGQTDDTRLFFSEALAAHLPKYDQNAKAAYYKRDYKKANRLFDSLIEHGLKGSYMDNFKFNNLNKKESLLYGFKKPMYLITYASWCVTSEGEIPAINQLATKYSDKIDFVILFWDDHKTTKKMAKLYNEHLKVLYVNEMNNQDSYVISKLKHSLGLPTTFLIDGNKKILDIRRGVTHPYGKSFEESFDMNYSSIFDGIANHLLESNNYNAERETVALN
ncbi:TlpA family protein disulfide reductase [Gillisia sp. Q332]|uniref:TlpA family protein disulfide reductase n=1 Tax=Gillisia xinjiangensis TaxID=3384765 RepID=UPI003919E25F